MCMMAGINEFLLLMLFLGFVATLGALHDCSAQRAEYGFNTKFNKIFLLASVFVLLTSIVTLVLYNFICLFI